MFSRVSIYSTIIIKILFLNYSGTLTGDSAKQGLLKLMTKKLKDFIILFLYYILTIGNLALSMVAIVSPALLLTTILALFPYKSGPA